MQEILQLIVDKSPLASLALIAGFMLVARAYARQTLGQIDARLDQIKDVAHEVNRVDADLRRLIAELPLHYQRRDEAIREYTAMNAKLDRLWDALVEMRGPQRAG